MKPLLILASLVFCLPLAGQHLHFGVKGGMPLNDIVETKGGFEGMPSDWTLGPMLELDLPLGLGIEFDTLYRRTGYKAGSAENTSAAWDFPLLAKYKFPGKVLRPYAAAGYAFRHIGDVPGILDNTAQGFIMGGGIRIGLAVLQISPEIRYTRWNSHGFDVQVRDSYARGSQNQFEFLIGLTF